MRILSSIILLLFAPTLLPAQTIRYVTDELRLESRSGPSTEYRIVRMLKSGTAVEVLEEKDGYSRLRLENGNEVWMLSRYLVPDPPARERLEKTMAELEREREENNRILAELSQFGSLVNDTERAKTSLAEDKGRLMAELKEIKETAASAIALKKHNAELGLKTIDLETKLQLAEEENRELDDSGDRYWFLVGAAAAIGGMLVGLLVSRVSWTRRQNWDEL